MALWPAPAARSYWTWDASSGAKAEVANPPEGDSWFDLDSDGDSLTNAQEALFGSDPYQIDTDQDGLRDDAEQQLSDPTAPFDPWLWDSNSNGYSDHDELYQRLQGYVPVVHYPSLSSSGRPFFSYSDADGDGLKNHEDSDPLNMDRDSDGILNWNDTAYMDDANNGYTPPPPVSDPGVWIGGNWYPTGTLDSDNDGMPDPYDPFPWGSYWYSGIEYGGWWTDSDGDGIPNPADGFPNGSFWYNTTEYAGLWVDRDGDGIPDPADLWPTIAYSFWYNAQEYPGIWSDQDSDSIPDAADPFPNGSYWWNGREHSGAWVDSDYDSIPDAHDAHPNGSFWYNNIEYSGTWTDMDADGIPDPADPFPQGGSYWYNAVEYAGPWSDRDSDTIPDPADVTPDGGYWFNGTEYGGSWMDWDGDGVPDPADLWPHDRWNNEPHFNYNGTDYAGVWNDRDSDNVPDPADAYPDDPENNADTDGDGLSNYHERTQHGTDPTLRDTDGEGLTDSEELYTYHTNPLEQKTHPNQPYTDYYTVDQTDTDGDGVPDRIEQWYAQLGYAMGSGTTDDAKADFDGDGYSNVQAYRNGWSFIAHLNHYDHDQDGILDVLEDMWSVSYPGILSSSNFEDAVQDYDGDGLMNVEEVALGLNPGSAHSRSTTVHDWQEWAWRQSMGTKAAWQALEDANQDGVPEGLAAFVNDDNAGSSGITLPQRAAWGDYDGDGMPDVWEYRHHLHLRDASDAQGNPDGDALTNLLEFQQNRDPWIQEDPPPPPLALGGHVPNGAVGEPYSATVAASGGTPGYSYSVSSGALPGGLSLDSSSGIISGVPVNEGTFNVFISVNDSTGQMASASYDVTIADFEIITQSLPAATRGADYTAVIQAARGAAPYTFNLITATDETGLPFGYTLQSNGTLTGFDNNSTGSQHAGTYTFTVQANDNAGRTATQTLTLVIEDAPPPPPLHFVTTQLPNAMAGWNYSSRLIVGGAQGTPTFSITGQPAWLQLSADGTLSGTPPTTGIHSFSVQVRDELYDPSLASFRTTSATFTLQQTGYQPVILTLLSGNRQNGVPGQPLPLPLVVRVTLNGEPMAGASVMFGDIPLTTHANGTASTHWLCPPSEGGFQVPVTSGSGSSVFQAWAIHPRGGHGSSLPRLDFNATAGPPPAPNTHHLLAHDAEVSLESRFVSENGGQIEAQYSQHVYKMADQGSGLTMLHQSGLPPYTQTRTNWSTSDGTAGREPEAPVPPLTQLTQWVPGATDGYHFSGKDTESGPVEGGPHESGGAGDGLPHVDHLLQEPGTFLDAGWFGRAHGVYQRTSSEVRLRRRTPSPTAPLPEIRRTFLLVTYETDANGVETLTQTEVKSLTMSPSENESHPLQLSPEAPAPGKSKRLRLLPVELLSDLNNDGQITSTDSGLREAATKSGASENAKEKGTEYLFINDKMSNGVWDADDDGVLSFSYGVGDLVGLGTGYGRMSKPPATHKDDDDAQALKISVGGLNTGVVWFDHSVIDKLEFFKTKECKAGDKINITASSPFNLSTGSLPETIYMRLRDDWSGVDSEDTLRMFVGKTVNETWAKITLPLTVIRDFGAKHFFHAARDYILENNSRVCIRDHGYPFGPNPSVIFRLCVMREEATKMTAFDAHSGGQKGIEESYLALPAAPRIPAVVINGNQCFWSLGYKEDSALDVTHIVGKIADKCHGRVIRGSVMAATSSDNFDKTTILAAGSQLAGPDPIPAGKLAGPDGIKGTADDIENDYANTPGGKYIGNNAGTWTFAAGRAGGSDALGGLSTNYASDERADKAHQMMGYAKGLETGKGCIFTATQIKGVGYGTIVKGDASNAGVPALSPSSDAGAIKLFILDSGGGSLALMHIDPAGTMRGAYMGRKTNFGFPYYVNNYLALDPAPARP
jgi:hypothetical protein